MWLILFRVLVFVLLAGPASTMTRSPASPASRRPRRSAAALVIIGSSSAAPVPGHHMVGALVGGVPACSGARLVWGALAGPRHRRRALRALAGRRLPGLHGHRDRGALKGEWFEPARIIAAFRDSSRLHQYKVLDTSVIIDGRIADICETGFLEGTLVVPQFVLRELQQVADSSDSLKRNRGRRGLDILQKIQKMAGVQVQIVETDFPEVREVDLKLIELARRMTGKIVTNDFNLNKVAQLRGVPC